MTGPPAINAYSYVGHVSQPSSIRGHRENIDMNFSYLDIPRVYFVENTSRNALRCHGESVPNINNITIFDGRELASMVVTPIYRLNSCAMNFLFTE